MVGWGQWDGKFELFEKWLKLAPNS